MHVCMCACIYIYIIYIHTHTRIPNNVYALVMRHFGLHSMSHAVLRSVGGERPGRERCHFLQRSPPVLHVIRVCCLQRPPHLSKGKLLRTFERQTVTNPYMHFSALPRCSESSYLKDLKFPIGLSTTCAGTVLMSNHVNKTPGHNEPLSEFLCNTAQSRTGRMALLGLGQCEVCGGGLWACLCLFRIESFMAQSQRNMLWKRHQQELHMQIMETLWSGFPAIAGNQQTS